MASQSNHQPCAKQDTNTQLMRKLISLVFTQNMTPWKHTANENHKPRAAQDITWMHTADKNTNCVHAVQHKTQHTWT